MICKKYKVIFIHIPKTAGTSIEYMFGFFEKVNNGKIILNKNIGRTHLSIKEIQEQFPEYYKDFYRFTIVRNPWSKALSMYNMLTHSKHYSISFKEYIKTIILPKSKLKTSLHRSQLSFITINGEIKVDYIMRYEELEKEWVCLCQKIQKPFETMVNMLKFKNPTESMESGYDQENIDLIAKIYKKDIEYFNYDFPAKTTS